MGPCQYFGCNCVRHALGQFELIGQSSACALWAPASISFSRDPAVGKSFGPTHQSRVLPSCVIDGPTRATCGILQFVKWAHVSAWVKFRSPCSRPIRAHRQEQFICKVGPLRAFRSAVILLSANHEGPRISLAFCAQRMTLAHASTLHGIAFSWSGPTQSPWIRELKPRQHLLV